MTAAGEFCMILYDLRACTYDSDTNFESCWGILVGFNNVYMDNWGCAFCSEEGEGIFRMERSKVKSCCSRLFG